jgi:hypothetical protein
MLKKYLNRSKFDFFTFSIDNQKAFLINFSRFVDLSSFSNAKRPLKSSDNRWSEKNLETTVNVF